MASIKQRPDGSWRARYRDENGVEHSHHSKTKAAGQAWLDSVTVSVATTGTFIAAKAGRALFTDYADEWLTTKADVAASTLGNVRGRLRKHAKPYFDGRTLAAIQPRHARAFVAHLVAKGLSPASIKSIVLTTAQVFDQAVEDNLIARSPFAKVTLPRVRSHDAQHFLTAEQVDVLANAIDERYRAAVYLGAYGGLRAGEMWALRVDHVNVLAATVTIDQSLSQAGGLHLEGTKNGKRRTIEIPRFLAEMLGEHIGRYPTTTGYVFASPTGEWVNHRNFYRRVFGPAALAKGLPKGLRFHDLRHTNAAFLIAAGRHMEEVKDYLGHTSIRVTSDNYGHLFPKAKAELAASLDATFEAAARPSADFSRTTGTVHALPVAPHMP